MHRDDLVPVIQVQDYFIFPRVHKSMSRGLIRFAASSYFGIILLTLTPAPFFTATVAAEFDA